MHLVPNDPVTPTPSRSTEVTNTSEKMTTTTGSSPSTMRNPMEPEQQVNNLISGTKLKELGKPLPLAPSELPVNALSPTTSNVVLDTGRNAKPIRGGRWSGEEHERFLTGFYIHGHKWKRVQQVVKTRTVTQVRTHAQKYLLKQKRSRVEEKAETRTGVHATPEFLSSKNPSTVPQLSSYSQNSMLLMSKLAPVGNPSDLMDHTHVLEDRSIAEAAFALCALMGETSSNNMGIPAAKASMPKGPVAENEVKRKYFCRTCNVEKRGHICPTSKIAPPPAPKVPLVSSAGVIGPANSLSKGPALVDRMEMDLAEPEPEAADI